MIFLVLAIAIGVQVFLTVKKVNPFLSLLLVAIISGFLLGMEPKEVLLSFEKGAGSTLAGLALVLCLGAVFGKILEASGAADQITNSIIQSFGIRYIQWGILLTGFLVGIPLYYNAGFIILVPLVFLVARNSGLSLLYIALPMAASLSVTHCFLPPHPGPVMLVNAFNADMGNTLLYGIFIAIPTVIVAGPFFAKLWKNRKVNWTDFSFAEKTPFMQRPSVLPSFLIAFVPILLILLSVVIVPLIGKNSNGGKLFLFLGDSTIAMLLAVVLAIYFFGLRQGKKMSEIMQWVSEGVSGIAMILLIITAGGIFKQVLIDSGAGVYVASFSKDWNMHPLVFGWLITAILRVSIGSATVAGLTAAGIVTPLVTAQGVVPELMVLAVGAGSVFGSHINDTGFWMFKEFFKLSLKETFFSWTLMEIIISVTGLIGVLVLDQFI
jgi:Gnt-I system high-affinity gluconate transporter